MNHANIALEYHLLESNSMIRRHKYKQFINNNDKLLISPYLLSELYGVQLQIQLVRRLLYCRIKVIRKHFQKFNDKQQKIIISLTSCMQLCQNMTILFGKCQDLGMNLEKSHKRKTLFLAEKMTLKQYFKLVEKEPIDKKSLIWLKNQEMELFHQIQQLLLYSYLYFKNSQVRESLRFLQKAYSLKPLNNFKSQLIYLEIMTLMNTAQFEIEYKLNSSNAIYDASDLLIQLIKEYYQPWGKAKISKYQMVQVVEILIVNLNIQSLQHEISDKYYDCIQSISLANFLNKNILEFLRVREEYRSYISQEHEIANEKFEQVILEEQDLNNFVGFLYGHKNKPLVYQTEGMKRKFVEPQGILKPKYAQFNKQQYYSLRTERAMAASPVPSLNLKCYGSTINDINSTNCKDNTTIVATKDNTNILNLTSNNVTRDITPRREVNSFNKISPQNKKKIILKNKRPGSQQSFLSQLVNLRKISDFDLEKKSQETELEKKCRELQEQLEQFDKKESVQAIDKFFKEKINQITFEKCMTLDQVKEMAKKIIGAEWEVHKEMPATKSLIKSISLSDIQFEMQQQFSKLKEYGDIEDLDFHNSLKDRAQLMMKENSNMKKLQLNQQKFQLKARMQKKKKSEPQLHKLMTLDTQDAGISPRFIKRRTTLLVNSYANIMQGARKLDINERKEREFKLTKRQLMEQVFQNLEDRDDLHVQDQILKQSLMPRQYSARAVYSPRGKEFQHSRTGSEIKIGTNSQYSTTTNFFQTQK